MPIAVEPSGKHFYGPDMVRQAGLVMILITQRGNGGIDRRWRQLT